MKLLEVFRVFNKRYLFISHSVSLTHSLAHGYRPSLNEFAFFILNYLYIPSAERVPLSRFHLSHLTTPRLGESRRIPSYEAKACAILVHKLKLKIPHEQRQSELVVDIELSESRVLVLLAILWNVTTLTIGSNDGFSILR